MRKDVNGTAKNVVLIRGAGEQATGVGWALSKAGFRVVMTEVAKPLMVRWPVCFGTAIGEKSWQVEGIRSVHISEPSECKEQWRQGTIPVIVDPDLRFLADFCPAVFVDATLAKRNVGTNREMAGLVIGMGPGFSAGEDVDLVVETNRGHNLGRLIYSGTAEANTGIPGEIAGYTTQRVLYSHSNGTFTAQCRIGELIKPGDILGYISRENGREEVLAPIHGVLRGLLRDGTPVEAKLKIGDIDPRGQKELCWTISDKARALGCAVLLGIMENRT